MNKTIMIIAGEASGDLQGAVLSYALKETSPELNLTGLGGENMSLAGVKIYRNIEDLSVVGLFEVLSNLKRFRAVYRLLTEKLDSEKPDCVVLIDYPEFNLRFAKEVKKRDIPLVYYISPQIWAWRGGRIKTIKRYVDKMIVLFKFEEELYRKEGVNVEFVGHPLLDIVKPRSSKEEFIRNQGLKPQTPIIAILPGSREIEVIRNLPVMAHAASLIERSLKGKAQFLVAKIKAVKPEVYDRIIRDCDVKMKIVEGYPYDCINASELALVASGTATLETAILEKPMIIIYRVSIATWLLGRMLVRIPYIGLTNIVAGEKAVPELIQFDATPQRIAEEAVSSLSSPERLNSIKTKLKKVRENLGTPGAGRRAAQAVMKILGS